MYLLDTGGQYADGTTDVTRTVHFGVPTVEQRRCYTRVLQGHLALASAVSTSRTQPCLIALSLSLSASLFLSLSLSLSPSLACMRCMGGGASAGRAH